MVPFFFRLHIFHLFAEFLRVLFSYFFNVIIMFLFKTFNNVLVFHLLLQTLLLQGQTLLFL